MGLTAQKPLINVDSEVPSCDLYVDPTLDFSELELRVKQVCRTLVQKWSHLVDDQLSVAPVSGGITNLLLKVSTNYDKGEEESVTVRVFGPNTDAVIDRKREFEAIPSLSAAGFGAKLLGVFVNGMVQTFIDARTLIPSDMSRREFAAHIAREVRRLHGLEVSGPKEPQLWLDMSKFLEKASVLTFEDNMKQRRYAAISFKEFREEMQALKVYCCQIEASFHFLLDGCKIQLP